jgi:(p)ppGpp synthase/HD superfamily hydrolase
MRGRSAKALVIPYLAHLLGVASIAIEYGATEVEAIGALLYDAGEDAGGLVPLSMMLLSKLDEILS